MRVRGRKILGLRCITCHHESAWPISSMLCPQCQGNQEVIFNYDEIRKEYKQRDFVSNPSQSIWRYMPLLPIFHQPIPDLPPIGWTPLIRTSRLAEDLGCRPLFLKDEGRNPSGSLKDRASAIVLQGAIEQKASIVVGASTGNAGSSMACLCASANMPCVIFVPKTAPEAKVAQLVTFGAHVLRVNGNYDQAFDLSLKIGERVGAFPRSTGYNPLTREGKKTCAYEIWEQFGRKLPDWVFVSVGDGNILSGLYKGFFDLMAMGFTHQMPRLAAIQSSASHAVFQAWNNALSGGRPGFSSKIDIQPVNATTLADSITVDFPRDGLAAVKSILGSNGMAICVDDALILEMIPSVARRTGIFGEPAGVACVAGLKKALAQGWVHPEEQVVCIITGTGLKDVKAALRISVLPDPIEPNVEAAMFACQEILPH